MYVMIWYAMMNEYLIMCYEIVCYGIGKRLTLCYGVSIKMPETLNIIEAENRFVSCLDMYNSLKKSL